MSIKMTIYLYISGGGEISWSIRMALRPIPPPVQWVQGLLPEGKASGAWRWPSPPPPPPPPPSTPVLAPRSNICIAVDLVWNVMAHEQKPDFVFLRNGRVHLNRCGRQFSRLLAAEVCASAVVMLDTPCSGVVWRVLATHSIRQFALHFPSRASPCAITFQLESTSE